MILVDKKGHLVTDGLTCELHEFAALLGLKREWFQDKRRPHYDLTTPRKRTEALELGANIVTGPRAIVKALRGEPMVPCDTCGHYDSKYDMVSFGEQDICETCYDNRWEDNPLPVKKQLTPKSDFNEKDVVNPT